jgi:hemoglobin
MKRFVIIAAVVAALAAGCAEMSTAPPAAKLKDGELQVPPDYKSWPKFLSAVQRPDAKQVREIYVNPAGTRAVAGQPFPNGTVFVMENFAAVELADGKLAQGSDGKLVKGPLLRVFVMGKQAGWGDSAPQGLKNGDWIYAAYDSAGKTAPDSPLGCRACHLPLADKDFVPRYDEYFASRK